MRFPHRARSRFPLALVAATLTILLTGCDSGGGSGGPSQAGVDESEPNNTPATADSLPFTVASGSVAVPGDVDYWSFSQNAGIEIQIQLFAARLDQFPWDSAGNVPRLTLYDTDGTTKLLEHDFGGTISTGWEWNAHDFDIVRFRVPADGTYFVAVTQAEDTLPGGVYALQLAFAPAEPGLSQVEAEAEQTTNVNDTFGTAQPITPGTVRGFYVDGEKDFYEFTTTAAAIVTFEVLSYRNGAFGGDDAYFDPELNLFDTDGTTLLRNNDDVYFYDPVIHHHLAAAGTYFISVDEYFSNTGDARYFLKFTSTPATATVPETESNDTPATANTIAYDNLVSGSVTTPSDVDIFSFPGTAGDMVRVQMFDLANSTGALDAVAFSYLDTDGTTMLTSNGYGDLQVASTILQASGTYFVKVEPDASPTTTTYSFLLTLFHAAAYETEPNDTVATSGTFVAGRAAGVIGTDGDIDIYQIAAVPNAERFVTIVIHADEAAAGSNGFPDFAGFGSDLAPLLTIRNANGIAFDSVTSNPTFVYTESVLDGLPTAQASFFVPAASSFYVEVGDALGGFGPKAYYVIEMR